jgi:hypothetical protein
MSDHRPDEAARTSETLVNFYQTTRRYNPEDSHLRTHRRENLKSNLEDFGISERIILKSTLKTYSWRVWTGLIRLSTGTVSRLM